MKYIILFMFPVVCSASLFGPVDPLREIPKSNHLTCLEGLRASAMSMTGAQEIERVAKELIFLDPIEQDVLGVKPVRLISAVNFDEAARVFMNHYIVYARGVSAMSVVMAREELARTRDFRMWAIRYISETPQTVASFPAMTLFAHMLSVVISTPALLASGPFLAALVDEIRNGKLPGLPADLIRRSAEWRNVHAFGLSEDTLSELFNSWAALVAQQPQSDRGLFADHAPVGF